MINLFKNYPRSSCAMSPTTLDLDCRDSCRSSVFSLALCDKSLCFQKTYSYWGPLDYPSGMIFQVKSYHDKYLRNNLKPKKAMHRQFQKAAGFQSRSRRSNSRSAEDSNERFLQRLWKTRYEEICHRKAKNTCF